MGHYEDDEWYDDGIEVEDWEDWGEYTEQDVPAAPDGWYDDDDDGALDTGTCDDLPHIATFDVNDIPF